MVMGLCLILGATGFASVEVVLVTKSVLARIQERGY